MGQGSERVPTLGVASAGERRSPSAWQAFVPRGGVHVQLETSQHRLLVRCLSLPQGVPAREGSRDCCACDERPLTSPSATGAGRLGRMRRFNATLLKDGRWAR